MDDLPKIVEFRADPVADLPEFLVPVTLRVHRPADTVVVVAWRCLDHFL